jgi:uncharacterized protein YhaN
MRLRSLRLERYGMFKDRSVELPADRMCLVFGANEAGKTTALSALADLLYGFPHLTEYDFRFDTKDLRLGGEVIGASGKTLRFRRRKGRSNTLIDDDDTPLPDDALSQFIGRSDRELFERAFGLSHQRLRDGGHAMLQAGGDIGESLIEAGSGITDLLDIQRALQAEAESLYTERKVQSKPFYRALGRYETARQNLRSLTLSGEDWRQAEKNVLELEARLEDLQSEMARKREEASRISRSRRVHSVLREIDQHLAALEQLKGVPDLPGDAGERRVKALDEKARAEEALTRLSSDQARIKEQLEEDPVDRELLARAQEIDSLYELRGEILANERDTPRRQADLDGAKSKLADLSKRLGFADTDALERLEPSELKLEGLKEAINEGTRAEALLRESTETLEAAKRELASVENHLRNLGTPADPAARRREVEALRALSPVENEMHDLQGRLRSRRERLSEEMSSLGMWKSDADALAQATLPGRAGIRQFQSQLAELHQKAANSEQSRKDAIEVIEGAHHRKEEVEAEGDVPTPGALADVRRERDRAWAVARRVVAGQHRPSVEEIKAVAGDVPLEDFVEERLRHADELADRRAAEARRIAEHASAVADVAAGERNLAKAEKSEAVAAEGLEEFRGRWHGLWRPLGIEPESPNEMLEWMEHARETLQLRREAVDLAVQLAKVETRMSKGWAKATELAEHIGQEPDTGQSLAEVADQLSDRIEELEDRWGQYRELTSLRAERQNRLGSARDKKDQAEKVHDVWKKSWKILLPQLGLEENLSLKQGDAALKLWEGVQSTRVSIEGLVHRIESMASVSRDFSERVKELSQALAIDLVDVTATEALVALFERLRQEQQRESRGQGLLEQLRGIEEQLSNTLARTRSAEGDLGALAELAGLKDPTRLKDVITKAAERTDRLAKLKAARDRLTEEGDGFAEDELRAESEKYTSEDLQRQELAVDQDMAQLTADLGSAATALEQARRRRTDLHEKEAAQSASQELHSALAELASYANDWARTRAASILLKEAIDRFRQEHQNPLLLRAGEIFRRITQGSFERFAVDYDEKDQPRLVGQRPDGSHCSVAGMSDGTRDQLYLSLRISALEAYCEKEEPLPFVGDDLFVHFDDDRARAALQMLADLSSCQVFLFTHHRHLVDIATESLSEKVSVVEI